MKNHLSRATPARAGLIGAAAGMAIGGFVHSLLPTGNIWFRAAMTGLSAGVAVVLISILFVCLASRRTEFSADEPLLPRE